LWALMFLKLYCGGGGFCGFLCRDAWWLNIRSNAHASRTKVRTISSNFFD
jgi:hypothetical protein